jgi:hypothetical protein
MSWELLLVPVVPVALIGMLSLSAWVERRIISPQALIVRAARGHHTNPDIAERLVTVETERLLRLAYEDEGVSRLPQRTPSPSAA